MGLFESCFIQKEEYSIYKECLFEHSCWSDLHLCIFWRMHIYTSLRVCLQPSEILPIYIHQKPLFHLLPQHSLHVTSVASDLSPAVLQHRWSASSKCPTHQTDRQRCVLKSSLNVSRNTCEWTYRQLHRLYWIYRHISKTGTSPEAQKKGRAEYWEEGSPISPHYMTTCASSTPMERFLHWSQLPSQGMIFINFMNNALYL